MKKKVLSIAILLIFLIGSAFANGSAEQPSGSISSDSSIQKPANFPKRPISIIVGSTAGGGSDLIARSLAESLDLGVAVNVVDRPGASGTLAATEVANSKPDGYTLNVGMPAATYIVPFSQEVPYTRDSFRNISVISPDEPLVFCVTPDSPIQDFNDFIELINSDKKVNLGTANPGSVGNIALNDLLMRWDADSNKSIVPFQGSSQALTALLGGHIDVTVADLLEITGRVANGTIKAIAVFGDERAASLPDVPCLKEFGIEDTGYAIAWKWISVPKDTPDDIVNYLKAVIDEAVVSEKYSSFIKQMNGLDTYNLTEEEINAKIDECYEAFGKIIMAINSK